MAFPIKLKDLGDLGNVIAALGVIISLLVVAWEIRGNTTALAADARLQMIQLSQQSGDWVLDPRFQDILFRGEEDVGSLDFAEGRLFGQFAAGLYDIWEQGFLLNRDGLLDDDYWKGWNRTMVLRTGSRGFRDTWEWMKDYYTQDFQSFVDRAYSQN